MQITVTVDEALYARAREIAAESDRTVEDVLEEKLREGFLSDSLSTTDHMPENASINTEITAYKAMHPELYRRYAEQWVAIHNQQLVDYDTDIEALETRLAERFEGKVVLVRRVEPTIRSEITVRSPRLIRATP